MSKILIEKNNVKYYAFQSWCRYHKIPFSYMNESEQQEVLDNYVKQKEARLNKTNDKLTPMQRMVKRYKVEHDIHYNSMLKWFRNNGYNWSESNEKTRKSMIEIYKLNRKSKNT